MLGAVKRSHQGFLCSASRSRDRLRGNFAKFQT